MREPRPNLKPGFRSFCDWKLSTAVMPVTVLAVIMRAAIITTMVITVTAIIEMRAITVTAIIATRAIAVTRVKSQTYASE
jgi:hypothetical protein